MIDPSKITMSFNGVPLKGFVSVSSPVVVRSIKTAIAFDTETHKIQPGIPFPPVVCASIAMVQGGAIQGEILGKQTSSDALRAILESEESLVGAFIAFDMCVMLAHDPSLLPLIFEKYKKRQVYDVLIAERLHALANGHMGRDPRNGATVRESLQYVVSKCLGRDNAKENDRWRTSYALLESTPIEDWPSDARQYPIDDAINTLEVAQAQTEYRNLHDLHRQCFADFCLQLGRAHGFTVDPKAIEDLKARTLAEKVAEEPKFVALGLLKETKNGVKKNTVAFKSAVAQAYGMSGQCPTCKGWGKVPGASNCPKTKCTGPDCKICRGSGKKPKTCKSVYENDECIRVGCDGTGSDLDSAPIPRTAKGGIGTGRDSLYESGDDNLIEFAHWAEKDKILSTYIPWLEKGLDASGGTIPLNPRPSVLKETGRLGASTEHQLPRSGGVRECIVARHGHLLGTCDWTGAELIAHAQSCLWLVGISKMADALNAGLQVHDELAARIIGVTYDHMVANRKTDKRLGDARQAAKPPNFGFPGLMGAATLVLQQRKQGPDTTAPGGKVYKGLRFCILAGGAELCGIQKVTEWRGRTIPPTCKSCLETTEKIKETWLQTWPENVRYFEIVKRIHSGGEMTQHWSKRVRGGMSLCATSNGFFQGLTGDLMKLALCRVSEEMHVKKDSDLYGARMIVPIHDEIFFEVRKEQASAAAKRVSAIMVSAMQEVCPDLANAAEAEPALMGRWYKGAEPVWIGDTLMPWRPEQ